MTQTSQTESTKLYVPSRRIITITVWILLALLLVNLIWVGGWGLNNIKYGTWLLLIGWLLYCVQFAPRMILDPRGVTLVNVVRTITIPWSAVDDIAVGLNTDVIVGNKRYSSWGAPGMSRRLRRDKSAAQGQQKFSADPTDVEIKSAVQRFKSAAAPESFQSVKITPNYLNLGVAAALAALSLFGAFA